MDRFQDAVERQIEEAMERGEFDDLPGSGRPLRLGDNDTAWWARRKIQELAEEDRLIEIAAEVQGRIDRLWSLPDEATLLAEADRLDELVEAVNDRLPATARIPRLSREEVVRTWHNMYRLRRSSGT